MSFSQQVEERVVEEDLAALAAGYFADEAERDESVQNVDDCLAAEALRCTGDGDDGRRKEVLLCRACGRLLLRDIMLVRQGRYTIVEAGEGQAEGGDAVMGPVLRRACLALVRIPYSNNWI